MFSKACANRLLIPLRLFQVVSVRSSLLSENSMSLGRIVSFLLSS